MQDVGKVRLTMNPQKKTLERIWQWLKTSVAPSLKLISEIGKLDNKDYVSLLVENGRMNDTQQRIYTDYEKSSQLRDEERRIFGREQS